MISTKYSPLFEKFWEVYPLKKGKGYAYQCWVKLKITKDDMDVILGAVEQQKQNFVKNEREWQYFKHPSTWLNQACWEDEPEPAPQTNDEKIVEAEKKWGTG